MSDEQRTSWRDRFFGSGPASEPAHEATAEESRDDVQHSAELAPDAPEVAATSVAEHDEHQPLVEHDADAHRAMADTGGSPAAESDADRSADSPIEPTVIAPSTLRGPSHSAAHPDDTVRSDAHGDAAASSLERNDGATAERAHDDAPTQAMDAQPSAEAASTQPTGIGSTGTGSTGTGPTGTGSTGTGPTGTGSTGTGSTGTGSTGTGSTGTEPPALVEPRRPSFGLRRQSDAGDTASGAEGGSALGGLAAAGAVGAAASAPRDERDERAAREFVEPEPTQAIDQQHGDDDATRALDTHGDPDTDPDTTRALPAQEPATETRPQRFGVVRDDDTRAASTVPVDDGTASATTAEGTPIVLVEEPVPPRRKGARGVGFAVALLATLIFAILFAAAFFAVGYLFDRAFDATETLQSLWLRPSYLLPIVVFFLAYWVVTLVVNRAGWWAHVLGAFIVALLVYGAHIGGAFMEAQGGWAGYAALPGIDAQALSQLVLAPLSVLAFVIAREVPVWVGGIVARRGRRARDWNRQAMDDFNAENAERLAAYERARG